MEKSMHPNRFNNDKIEVILLRWIMIIGIDFNIKYPMQTLAFIYKTACFFIVLYCNSEIDSQKGEHGWFQSKYVLHL